MGFVKGIFGKIHHILIDAARRFFVNPLGYAAGNLFRFVSVNKVRPLLFHHRLLLFTHGTAHQIAPPQGVASQITDNLHYLLLVNDTAIGRL